jgi:phosphatidylinositol alpha-1,6-mannosyltransferase
MSVLLGFTGLCIDGGIAVVSRCIARALDEETQASRLAGTDRVLLLDDPANSLPPPARGAQHFARGSQARFVWQLWRAFRRRRHDLVLFDLVGIARSAMLPLPGFPPPRTAIFVHGLDLPPCVEASRARALRHTHRVLANSEFTADQLRRMMPDVSDRIRVVPLCIDPERVTAWEKIQRTQAPRRERAALIVARMWAEERGKGHDQLLEAWPEVRRRLSDAELWVVGGGDDATRLQAKARELGVGDSVRFLGRVSDAELADLYQRASLFAMPSRQEGFGVVYAEAMWWGLPCIGTTADASGQVIAAGETGELVPYGDIAALGRTLVDLLSDELRLERMRAAGRLRAREQFGFTRFRADLLNALELS